MIKFGNTLAKNRKYSIFYEGNLERKGAQIDMEFEKIRNIIAEVLDDVDADDITEESTFKELEADSLDLFEIIMAIEEEFGIEIPTEEAEKIQTVGDAVEQIKKNVG